MCGANVIIAGSTIGLGICVRYRWCVCRAPPEVARALRSATEGMRTTITVKTLSAGSTDPAVRAGIEEDAATGVKATASRRMATTNVSASRGVGAVSSASEFLKTILDHVYTVEDLKVGLRMKGLPVSGLLGILTPLHRLLAERLGEKVVRDIPFL
jgi:hypothetical protein